MRKLWKCISVLLLAAVIFCGTAAPGSCLADGGDPSGSSLVPEVLYCDGEREEEFFETLTLPAGALHEFSIWCEGADRVQGGVMQLLDGESSLVANIDLELEDGSGWLELDDEPFSITAGTYTVSMHAMAGETAGEDFTFTLIILAAGNISYEFSEGTLTVSGSGAMPDYELVFTNYAEYTDAPWNEYLENTTSIVISDGITSIGNWAFSGFEAVTSVSIPDSVVSLGTDAFYHCTALTSVDLPDGITSIGAGAFFGCENLVHIGLPAGLKSIGDWAFMDCTSLTNVVLPSGLKSIGTEAFCECGQLGSITLPAGLKHLGIAAFASCGLTEIRVASGATTTWDFFYGEDSGCHLYHIALPDSVTKVDEGAFIENRLAYDAPDFVTPENLTTVEAEAFAGVDARFVWFEDDVETIGEEVLADSNVRYVFIPYGCRSIGPNAFPRNTIILGFFGSYYDPSCAENYADANGYEFCGLESPFSGNG